MHEPTQTLVALLRRNNVLTEARKLHPVPLDIFKMPSLEYAPAPADYGGCRIVELDGGRHAVCCAADLATLERGKRVLVLKDLSDIAVYWYDPPRLVPAEDLDHFPGTLPTESPDHQIIGRLRAYFVPCD